MVDSVAQVLVRTARQERFLKTTGVVSIPAQKSFRVSDLFVADSSDAAIVKIERISDVFFHWFDKLVVPDYSGADLPYYTVMFKTYDDSIFAALHGDSIISTSLAEVWWLLLKQSQGGPGVLLTTGESNVFYIKDRFGVFRTVCLYWCKKGWRIRAAKLCCRWFPGTRVFSRLLVAAADLPVDNLVTSETVIMLSALGEKTYLAADWFTPSSSPEQPIIFRVSEYFTKWFGPMIIESRQSSVLTRFLLTRRANNPSIIKALGGEDRCITNLSDILLLLKHQAKFEEEAFLSLKYSNVFYVRDKNNEIKVVSLRADNDGRGWCVSANKVSEGNWNRWQRVLAHS